ncbi:MAG TPA: phage baseplate assembly protein V [Myxococcota bacterium]|nr:phage baseplate assembly protein V [Myxococcota bacterium]
MDHRAPFERAPWPGAPHPAFGHVHLAKVVDDKDPDGLDRVQVRLYAFDGVDGQDAAVWARVAVSFAGNGYGALLIPKVDEEVLVTFLQGDPRFPIVVGALWNGANRPPEDLSSNGVDRWLWLTPAGSRVELREEQGGQPRITIETPGGVRLQLDDSGSKALLENSDSKVEITPGNILIQSSGTVKVQASTVQVDAGSVTVNAAMSRFNGVVQADTLIATTVVGTTYTPGAGNVW